MPKPVVLHEHTPRWEAIFHRESQLLAQALGSACVTIHHVGSTAVPGLTAKPIVDILIPCTSLSELEARRSAMESAGYVWEGEYGIPDRRYFTKETDESPMETVHVHVYARGHPDIERMIRFRDCLRASPKVAAEYVAIKRDLQARFMNNRDAYTAGKADFITSILARTPSVKDIQHPADDL